MKEKKTFFCTSEQLFGNLKQLKTQKLSDNTTLQLCLWPIKSQNESFNVWFRFAESWDIRDLEEMRIIQPAHPYIYLTLHHCPFAVLWKRIMQNKTHQMEKGHGAIKIPSWHLYVGWKYESQVDLSTDSLVALPYFPSWTLGGIHLVYRWCPTS